MCFPKFNVPFLMSSLVNLFGDWKKKTQTKKPPQNNPNLPLTENVTINLMHMKVNL